MTDPAVPVAAVAGLASFLSPCMLPVVPAFVAHMGGVALEGDLDRPRLLGHAALFVVGFSLVFAGLSVVLEAVLSSVAGAALTWVSRAAGLVIFAFGLHVTGIVDIRPLSRQYEPVAVDGEGPLGGDGSLVGVGADGGYPASLVLGGAFAVAWTPCAGPVLGSTLTLAAARPTAAFPVLLAYSLGLGLPFLLVALVPRRAQRWVRGNGSTVARAHRAFGVALLALGALVFSRRLELLASLPRWIQG